MSNINNNNNSCLAGLDKCRFIIPSTSNINIEVLKTLNSKYTKGLSSNSPSMNLSNPETGELMTINRMDIKNLIPGINQISIGTKKGNNKDINYSYIDITLPTVLFGCNKNNINKYKDFLKVIDEVNSYINSIGLFYFDFDLKDLEISSIEINKNILTTEDFFKYKKSIDLIFKALQPKLSSHNKIHGIDEFYTGSTCGNTTTTIVVYDKSAQLKAEKNITMNPNEKIMRFEIKKTQFNKRSKNTFNKLLVGSSFEELLESLFVDSLNIYVNNGIENILSNQVESITNFLNNNSLKRKPYLKTLIQGNEIFDIIIPLYALKNMVAKSNYTKTARNLISSALNVNNKNILFGNFYKLNEILLALGLKPIELPLSPIIEDELEKIYISFR